MAATSGLVEYKESIMLLQISNTEFIETDGMSDEEVRQFKWRTDEEVDLIVYQLEMARIEKQETGRYRDSQWFARATFALSCKRRVQQRLQEIIGQRSKRAKEIQHASQEVAEYFVQICKETMDNGQFGPLLAKAQERRKLMMAQAGLAVDEEESTPQGENHGR
jgi:hypothetical protein